MLVVSFTISSVRLNTSFAQTHTTDPKDSLWISFGLEWDKQKSQHSLPTAQQDTRSTTGGIDSRRPARQQGQDESTRSRPSNRASPVRCNSLKKERKKSGK